MKRYWLNVDSLVEIKELAKQRILINNPEALKSESADSLWSKIVGCLGKYEFEMWLAETIIGIAMRAVASGAEVADLTKISDATLYIKKDEDDVEWEKFLEPEYFKQTLIKLPIFEISRMSYKEIILKVRNK